jgi:YggT family protein
MLGLLLFVLDALWWIIVIDAVLSWVMPQDKFPRSLTTQITDPLYSPIRSVLSPEKTGGFDVSPLAILFMIWLAKHFVAQSM